MHHGQSKMASPTHSPPWEATCPCHGAGRMETPSFREIGAAAFFFFWGVCHGRQGGHGFPAAPRASVARRDGSLPTTRHPAALLILPRRGWKAVPTLEVVETLPNVGNRKERQLCLL